MNYTAIIIIGATIGLASGFFGIGGALIGTPLLKIFAGLPALLALATPLPAAIPSAIAGSIVYHQKKLIDWRLAKLTILFALPSNFIGSYITKFADGDLMMYCTGTFMTIVGISFIIRGWLLKEERENIASYSIISALFVGLLTGFLSGFLAIGGGLIMVPAFVKINKVPMKTALATSLVSVAILSIPGTIMHYILGHINEIAALILCLTVIPFSNFAAKLSVKLKNKTLEKGYGVFMIVFAIYFIVNILSN